MTTATVAQPTGTQFAVLYVMFLLIAFLYGAILWQREGVIDRHDDDLGDHDQEIARLNYRMEELLKALGLDIPDPVEDDSPEAMAEPPLPDGFGEWPEGIEEFAAEVSDDTDEFPALPATEPSGIPIQVHSALIEAPTHELMTPETAERQRVARAAFVEEQLAKFTFTGRDR